jgi:hypothetical protein
MNIFSLSQTRESSQARLSRMELFNEKKISVLK